MTFTLQPMLFLIAIFSIFLYRNVHSQCLADQQSLLLQLKNNLTFDPVLSEKLVHWNQSDDCCSWDEITCSDGRVIGLDLSFEFITGGLDNSSSLFSLQYLQNLSLASNNFNSSQIPSGFDKLTNLSYLNLSNAGFGGQIPIEISRLTRLVTLDLSSSTSSYFSLLILKKPNLATLVQNLSELVELHLNGVNISPQGNEWCKALSSSLPNLKVLSLSNSFLSSPIDSSLLNLRSLSIIHLDNNNFSAPVPNFFTNFTSLTSLSLSSSGLNGTLPENIFQVLTLETLDLSYNSLHGPLPEFPENASLRSLVLSMTNISGSLPRSIGNLKMLSRLDLSICNFSGSIPSSVANLTQLVYLDMSSNKFNGSIPSFSMAKNMTQIILSGNDLAGQISSTDWKELQHLVILKLDSNSLNGSIPVSLLSHPSLQILRLSENKFSGKLNEFNTSSSLLDTLDLSSNNLEGPIPMSVFDLRGLMQLSLSWNKFNGSFPLHEIQHLRNLSNLALSYNSLLVEYRGTNSLLSSSLQLSILELASLNLTTFPDFLRNQSSLTILDLSENNIHGEIPNWISQFQMLWFLDLSFNLLRGLILVPPQVIYLNYAGNNLNSSIPASIGDKLVLAYSFIISSNNFSGSIPESICQATNLLHLDLSNNSFSGEIPRCLYEMKIGVLVLRGNKLSGIISDSFPVTCSFHTLVLSGNILGGVVPKSLANCTSLVVLALGDNQIKDKFPCHLKNISKLRILGLQYNKFYGPIGCLGQNATWPRLQIVDLASNNFSGTLPKNFFKNWEAMMADGDKIQFQNDYLRFGNNDGIELGNKYQVALTITFKGVEREFVKTLGLVTTIDVSCNNFTGPILEEIGALNALVALNLSHNAFTGQMPPSLGNLTKLESLDLSRNNLKGEIPTQLANLNFLSVMDLSFNHLEGKIPTGTQLQSLPASSFEGNTGLCGPPLSDCGDATTPSPPTFVETHSNHRVSIAWKYISAEVGFVFGFGIVIFPLMFWRRWRIWYYNRVDDVLFRIFPELYLGKQYRRRGRRVFRNRR